MLASVHGRHGLSGAYRRMGLIALSVYLSTVSDPHDEDSHSVVLDITDHSTVANAVTP